jgi:hypothetical protein
MTEQQILAFIYASNKGNRAAVGNGWSGSVSIAIDLMVKITC